MNDTNLKFSNLPVGTHQTPWDLNILLHHGAAKISRKIAGAAIIKNELGGAVIDRMSLVTSFHEAVSSMISLGKSRSLIEGNLEVLWRFFAWSDSNSKHLSKESIIEVFKAWTEYQIYRSQITKDVSANYAYRQVSKLASLIVKALGFSGNNSGGNLMKLTRMRKPEVKKKVLSAKADKENLSDTFEFGHALKKICDGLDVSSVRGKLPIIININDSAMLVVAGSLSEPMLDVNTIKDKAVKKTAIKARAPLKCNENLLDGPKRSRLLNLRIEAELLIFIAQTGMNLTQASRLETESYRWKSSGEDLEVFRVYKGRRSGEAIFRCYKLYRAHLEIYVEWLRATGLSDNDTRLFPRVSRSIIPVEGSKVKFYAIRPAFTKIGLRFIGPQQLRKTRVNWLLRQSRNVELTAEQMAHDKEVLLKDYEAPHHQLAVSEIIKFHALTDPSYSPPGPGKCVDVSHQPVPIANLPKEAPEPDCISPEGCLFCTKHRDIMTIDYCWKLASHARIKSLESSLNKQTIKNEIHPSHRVIDRIMQKLDAIAAGSDTRSMWVKDTMDAVRSGRYHPYWAGHIELLEIIT